MPRRKIENPAETLPGICERIRFFRGKAGIGQNELAKAIAVTANTVSNWENGRARPDINLLPGICRALHVSLYDLFGMENHSFSVTEQERRMLLAYRSLTPEYQSVMEKLLYALSPARRQEECPEIRILKYCDRPLAAGVGDPTEFSDAASPFYVYAKDLPENAEYVFPVSGDSMEPRFRDRDLVLVSGSEEDRIRLKYGDFGAFLHDNGFYIKQYEPDGLHSLNPKYPVMTFHGDEPVYLIGPVLGVLPEDWVVSPEDLEKYRQTHGA